MAYSLPEDVHERPVTIAGADYHTPPNLMRLAMAEAAVQVALRLRPDAGEAHLARAEHLYRGYLDHDGALAELEIVRAGDAVTVNLSRLQAGDKYMPVEICSVLRPIE